MALVEDLERIAVAATTHGEVAGVLAAEPSWGRRLYLVALGTDGQRRWLVLDDDAQPIERRDDVRDTASIVAMCELAGDLAGGGDLNIVGFRFEKIRLDDEQSDAL